MIFHKIIPFPVQLSLKLLERNLYEHCKQIEIQKQIILLIDFLKKYDGC